MSVSEKPRAWWRFIRDALLGDIRAKKRRQSLEYISHRRRQRLAYMELWMAKLDNQLTTFDSKYQLQALEKDLSADDIL
jgi:vacuolar protein sorting-associated protein 13A/C